MTRDDTPERPAVRRPISPAVFDRLFEAGIDRGNALDVDEPKLCPPNPDQNERAKPKE